MMYVSKTAISSAKMAITTFSILFVLFLCLMLRIRSIVSRVFEVVVTKECWLWRTSTSFSCCIASFCFN